MPAVPTGQRTDIAVLDIDIENGKDGDAELRALGNNLEELSPLRVATPSGGQHIYFRWHKGLRNSASQTWHRLLCGRRRRIGNAIAYHCT